MRCESCPGRVINHVSTGGKIDSMRTSETRVMLNPIMDVDIRQVEDTRCVVPTEDASDHVRDIPTES
jgi:hypothetical protein